MEQLQNAPQLETDAAKISASSVTAESPGSPRPKKPEQSKNISQIIQERLKKSANTATQESGGKSLVRSASSPNMTLKRTRSMSHTALVNAICHGDPADSSSKDCSGNGAHVAKMLYFDTGDCEDDSNENDSPQPIEKEAPRAKKRQFAHRAEAGVFLDAREQCLVETMLGEQRATPVLKRAARGEFEHNNDNKLAERNSEQIAQEDINTPNSITSSRKFSISTDEQLSPDNHNQSSSEDDNNIQKQKEDIK